MIRPVVRHFAILGCVLALSAARAEERRGPAPTAFQRQEALDEMQAAIGLWLQERRAFGRELAKLREDQRRRDAPDLLAPAAPEDVEGFEKIIEVPPQEAQQEDAATTVEAEVQRMEAELDARREACKADPQACARERERRRLIREGNRAWTEALEKKRREREAALEAEARRLQAELDAARRKEAQERARQLGGRIDAEGNFVDEDLDQEIRADEEAKDD